MPSYTLAETYAPFDEQVAFHRSNKRFKIAAAGNRGGKTISGAAEFVANVFRDMADPSRGRKSVRIGATRVPRLAYWVVTPTHELGEFPYRELVRIIPRELIERVNASTREMWIKGDVQIGFRSTERPERLVAASLNGIWMDEACRCKSEAWRGGLRARLADQSGWAIFTSSPLGGRNNWVYQDLVSQAGVDEHVGSFNWATDKNPHIPRAEIEHAQRTMPAAWYARDWQASWDAFGGTIYSEFNDDTHVLSEAAFRLAWRLPNRVNDQDLRGLCTRIVAGVDFGYTSAGAIVVVGQLRDNAHVILEESYAPSRPVSGSASVTWVSESKRLMQRWGVSVFSCDPSRPDAINDMLVNSIPAVGANNDIHLGIRRVAEALHVDPVSKRPGMHILSNCQNVIREMRDYQWKATKDQGGFAEVPADGQSDHGLDGLRYAMIEHRPYASPKRDANYRSNGRPIG